METKTYAKLVDGQLITTCVAEDDMELAGEIKADGFKLYDEDAGKPEVGEYQTLSPVYRETEDSLILYWEIVDNDPAKIREEIDRLEEQLSATDYKIIKSYEYTLAGEEPPYDIAALHAERESLRMRIRELEQMLAPEG